VPAKIAGKWEIKPRLAKRYELTLKQHYQWVDGRDGREKTLRAQRIAARNELSFALPDSKGDTRFSGA
jgi:hypothetical protein